mmetsp:Transcript_12225/g.23401  ORF Transcript_12225/g.23401 Transcript_12225/m.23401 type:complete len:91 (-) Transcript_12225:163-435(-)
MSLSVRSLAKARTLMPTAQRRTFIDWMTNYPDKINELKKVHQAGGRATFTWMKMPQDKYTNLFGAALMTFGMAQCAVGYYRLATGKGKMD